MDELEVRDVIRPVGTHPLLQGLSRVLHINKEADLIVVIPIEYEPEMRKPKTKAEKKRATKARRGGDHPQQAEGTDEVSEIECPRYYWRGWKRRSFSALQMAYGDARIVKVASIELPKIVTMTDDEIQERYPPRERVQRTRPTKRKDGRLQRPRRQPRKREDGTPMSATLDIREERLDAIHPIIDRIQEVGSSIFEADELAKLVKARTRTGLKSAFVSDSLHRYLALGCGQNALLGNLERCGGEGPREQTQRIGKPLGLYNLGIIEDPGKWLTEGDKKKIEVAWHTYVEIEKLPQEDAYLLFLGAFYSNGVKLHHGVETPILLPIEQRPSFRQFKTWGPRGEGNKSAFEAHLKPQEWEQKYRALVGTVTRTIPGIGHTAFIDSTRTNTVLVSMVDRLRALGTGHRILIHDAFSDVVPTPYCGLNAPSEETALLAVLTGARSVVPIAKRLGLDLTEDQIPRLFSAKYIGDNTDLRTRGSMQALKQCGSSIEYTEVNRPERKGPVESGHHEFNANVDEAIDGSNHGRQRDRGEEKAAVLACWTCFEYFAELLLAIAYHNTQADASALFESHPCRTEMARAGVARTRMAIFQWAKRAPGRDCTPPHDLRVLRARLLPTYPGRVFPGGVRVMRPDRGRKREYISGLRFAGPTTLGLQERARRGEEIILQLRLDPCEPAQAWFADEKGMHELTNLCADPIKQREATLYDYLAQQDHEHVQDLLGQSEREQADFDFTNHRTTKNLSYRAAKKLAIESAKSAGQKVTKKSLGGGIALNRAAEVIRLKEQLDLVNPARGAGQVGVKTVEQAPGSASTTEGRAVTTQVDQITSEARAAMRRYREERRAA